MPLMVGRALRVGGVRRPALITPAELALVAVDRAVLDRRTRLPLVGHRSCGSLVVNIPNFSVVTSHRFGHASIRLRTSISFVWT